MDEQLDPNIGKTLINRYRLIQLIGQGSMGKVYRAEDQLLGDVTVAVKFLSQTLLNAKMKQRFADEARTGAQLGQRSIHIVRVLDYGVHQGEAPFYVMEYMEGKNLNDVIVTAPLSVKRFFKLARHICLGLQCAHDGIKIDGKVCKIVHRDIKPSNVFVISDPGLGEVAKVLDFGIAKLFRDQQGESRQTRSFMGTLAYSSPEQIEGKDLDARSDIYSLGITMFETLTGKMPIEPDAHTLLSWYKAHKEKPPKRFADTSPHLKLPPGLEDLVMSCMAKKPEDRPQNMVEILKILERIRDEQDGVVPQRQSSIDPAVAQTVPETVETKPETESQASSRSTHVPNIPLPQQRFWSIEQAGWSVGWPEDKPVAEIVFPRILTSDTDQAVGLWVMLSRSEIQQRLLSSRYNQFLCLMAPHPMMLWITAIYDSQLGARWLPCYLDLKQALSQEFLQLLSHEGYYLLLFFASEYSEEPANVKTITIAPYQRQLFQNWLVMAKQAISTAPPTASKRILKTEFERIKPTIIKKLESARSANTPLIF